MKKILIVFCVGLLLLLVGLPVLVASLLTAPVPVAVGSCPADLVCENVEFASESGSTIKGWMVRGKTGNGAVVLMHGLRGSRLALVDRIRFLREAGFSVLAFDFQGSGESEGKMLTLGYLESRDATAAVRFAKQNLPNERIGVVGISMGGAAFLLQKEAERVDALVLEMVYPTMQKAVENRLNMWLFKGADNLAPLLTAQFPLRIGVSVDELRPLDRIKDVHCPTFLIVGENDRHTTLEESRQLFEAANQPKDIWVVPRAEHGDLLKNAPQDYETKVLQFFDQNLRGEKR